MIYQPSNSLIEALRNLFKQRVKDGRLAYLGNGNGIVQVAGRNGYVWARFPNGTDGVGNVAYSAPFQVRDTGVAHLTYEGAAVYVAYGYNGEPEIVSSNYRELDNAGIDTRVLNPLEPQSKWVYPFQLVIALALAVGTKVTTSTKVSISKLIHYNTQNNTFKAFETTPSDSSLIDLASSIPTTDQHRYAMLWLDTYSNTVTVTTSTAQSLFTPLDLTDVQECATQRPADSIPIKAFYLANNQSSIVQTSMDVDVRQFLNVPPLLGFPQTLTSKERVHPNRTVLLPPYTTSGAGAVTVETGGRVTIVPHTNVSATSDPTINDDSGDGYSDGSLWVNTTTNTVWFCADAALGAAVWVQVVSGAMTSFSVAGDSGTPQTITNGNTLTLDGTNDIVTAATATDTVTISGAGLCALAPTGTNRNVFSGDSNAVAMYVGSGVVSLRMLGNCFVDSVGSGGSGVFRWRSGSFFNVVWSTNNAARMTVGSATVASAMLHVIARAATDIVEIVQGTTSQTADLFQTQDVSANVLTRLDTNGGAVFNEQGSASGDVRIEGDTDTSLLFTDASADFVGVGTNAPNAKLDINSDKIRLRTAKTPSSASDTGNAGDICWDSDYIYVCVATNTWKRTAITTW